MAYSTDADIVKIRPNILQLGVSDWSDMHNKSAELINRVISRRWYKDAAANYSLDWRDTEFDSSLVDSDQLLDLSCYKTLELCYRYLMKDSEKPDGFERQMNIFRDLYNQELEEVLAIGISYDWDGSGSATDSEKFQRQPRRLTRV